MSVPVLRTPRLTLRGIESSDLDALVAVFANPAMSDDDRREESLQ